MNRKEKVVAYLQTATSANGKPLYDPQIQLLSIEVYAKQHNLTVVKIFEHSGFGYEHFEKVYAYCSKEDIKTVLITTQDIISDDYQDAVNTIVVFDNHGIEVKPVDMVDRKDFKYTLLGEYRHSRATGKKGQELLDSLGTMSGIDLNEEIPF